MPTRTLGPISAKFINELLKNGRELFVLDDAVKVYGRGKNETIKFLSDLISRGVLARIKPSVYMVLQMGRESAQLSNWPILARALAVPDSYFISHYSAMRIHGMTTHPAFDIYISMPKRHRLRKINNMNYHFIYLHPNHFWGFSVRWINKHEKVCISDLERTILDGLERPELCGGVKEIIRGVWAKKNEVNWERLANYAAKYRTKSAVKRLGFILELLELGQPIILELLNIILNAKDYILLEPMRNKEGKRLSRWRVRINENLEELKQGVWG